MYLYEKFLYYQLPENDNLHVIPLHKKNVKNSFFHHIDRNCLAVHKLCKQARGGGVKIPQNLVYVVYERPLLKVSYIEKG